MGGHGGLNILPQKRWNVYNYENREKVRRDEEAAAREEQLEREKSRRRDAEFRLDRLRRARGIHQQQPPPSIDDSRHFSLFDGPSDFASLGGAGDEGATRDGKRFRKEEAEDGSSKSSTKRRREDVPTPVAPEDEKYKLGYGLVGKGVKAPWYVSRPSAMSSGAVDEEIAGSSAASGSGKKKSGKKSIEELREERMRREKKEKERERTLLAPTRKKDADRSFPRKSCR
ncbi:leukocyte receptor cluster member 1 [Canna indica]|uniref:Leukocyte receptor cluster member 1 n=1 Tax=Canna indica TaxID=4628 RepID=A0AAQ3KQL6_9LILI|nr:leukocyte receptor cluster member 1 [Canna indica]